VVGATLAWGGRDLIQATGTKALYFLCMYPVSILYQTTYNGTTIEKKKAGRRVFDSLFQVFALERDSKSRVKTHAD
jgi:hypothetical protein